MSMIRDLIASHPATTLPPADGASPSSAAPSSTAPSGAAPSSAAPSGDAPHAATDRLATGRAATRDEVLGLIDLGVAATAAKDTFDIVSGMVDDAASTMVQAGELTTHSAGAVRRTMAAVAVPLSALDHYHNDVRVASSDELHAAASLAKAGADAFAGTVGSVWNVGLGVTADIAGFVAPDTALADGVELFADATNPSTWLAGGAAALIDSAVVVTEGALAADDGIDGSLAAASRASDRLDEAARAGDYGVAGRLAPHASDRVAGAH